MTEEQAPFDDLHCIYLQASGPACHDCVMIGRRWRDGYGSTADDSDFWIVTNRLEDGKTRTRPQYGPMRQFLTGCWRAPSGVAYFSNASDLRITVMDDPIGGSVPPRLYPLGILPKGIWGLDDEHVWTWGMRKREGKQEQALFFFDGKEWSEVPSPDFAISAMHGTSPDLLYAVGWQGGIARLDRGAWTRFPAPTAEVLSDVFVAGPDEIYAVGEGGMLLEGSSNGWAEVWHTQGDGLGLFAVAKFLDTLYIGAGPLGAFRRVGGGDVVEHFKPKWIGAAHIDARQELVITCDHMIVGSVDGEKFKGVGVNLLHKLTATQDILS